MTELDTKAKHFIKTHGMSESLPGGLLSLSSLQLYTIVSTEFPPDTRREIFNILRKVYYINFILEWKIYAFVGERKMIQSEFKELCVKWELLENIITRYHDTTKAKKATETHNLIALDMIKAGADGFAPLTIFKSGKVQLQNRYIQREFEKLRNAYKKRLSFHTLIALTLTKYIDDNNLAEYIAEDIKSFIKDLQTDLAHSSKYSTEQFILKYGIDNDSIKKYEAKKYAVYPALNEEVIEADESDYKTCYEFLFSDLEQIELWQKEQWGI